MAERYKISASSASDHIHQGEFLQNVNVPEFTIVETAVDGTALTAGFASVRHQFMMVVSPECDLLSDFLERQKPIQDQRRSPTIPEILVCDLYTRSELELSAGINSGLWKWIKTLQHPRYHYFEEFKNGTNQVLPEMAADFQFVSGISTTMLYSLIENNQATRTAILNEPYRQQFVHRLTSWLGKVDVP